MRISAPLRAIRSAAAGVSFDRRASASALELAFGCCRRRAGRLCRLLVLAIRARSATSDVAQLGRAGTWRRRAAASLAGTACDLQPDRRRPARSGASTRGSLEPVSQIGRRALRSPSVAAAPSPRPWRLCRPRLGDASPTYFVPGEHPRKIVFRLRGLVRAGSCSTSGPCGSEMSQAAGRQPARTAGRVSPIARRSRRPVAPPGRRARSRRSILPPTPPGASHRAVELTNAAAMICRIALLPCQSRAIGRAHAITAQRPAFDSAHAKPKTRWRCARK